MRIDYLLIVMSKYEKTVKQIIRGYVSLKILKKKGGQDMFVLTSFCYLVHSYLYSVILISGFSVSTGCVSSTISGVSSNSGALVLYKSTVD